MKQGYYTQPHNETGLANLVGPGSAGSSLQAGNLCGEKPSLEISCIYCIRFCLDQEGRLIFL